ncbi:acyl carrier protein [Streptomyces sp. NPDC006996]|uniref:acyl carrier protein n=1 Tax=Streptomyces sp. NPDC006996 TaxID=3156908 RepID=UPI0033DE4939
MHPPPPPPNKPLTQQHTHPPPPSPRGRAAAPPPTAVGADDDVFDLGADSLTALRLTGRIEAELDVGLDVSAVFRHRTPRALAAALTARRGGSETAPHGRTT